MGDYHYVPHFDHVDIVYRVFDRAVEPVLVRVGDRVAGASTNCAPSPRSPPGHVLEQLLLYITFTTSRCSLIFTSFTSLVGIDSKTMFGLG